MTEMKTSEVLDLSADVIEQRGWTTGSWNNTREGAPVCIEGGIAAALGLTVDMGSDDQGAYKDFSHCPAYVAVQEYLGFDDVLYKWNDNIIALAVPMDNGKMTKVQLAHSQEEVVAVLRAAAAVERAKEDSLEGAEVTA